MNYVVGKQPHVPGGDGGDELDNSPVDGFFLHNVRDVLLRMIGVSSFYLSSKIPFLIDHKVVKWAR